jgi:hypothetical protein
MLKLISRVIRDEYACWSLACLQGACNRSAI